MSRNDGRPKSVGVLKLDPLPWATFEGGTGYVTKRHASEPVDVYCEFKPRPGFIQDEKSYGF